jgi:hypothetical protein
MNIKFKLSIIFLSLMLCSCLEHDEAKNKDSETPTKEKKESNKLVFEIDLHTTEPDSFTFFSNDVFLNNNQFMNIGITQRLNMNETTKNLKFEFPNNIKPDAMLGFSLGSEKTKEVTIKNIKLSYGDTKFDITSDNIENYFTFNKFIEYDASSKVIRTKRVDNLHNPLLFLRMKILDSIQNIN